MLQLSQTTFHRILTITFFLIEVTKERLRFNDLPITEVLWPRGHKIHGKEIEPLPAQGEITSVAVWETQPFLDALTGCESSLF